AELYRFLREVNRIAPDERGHEILARLCEASNRAVGGLASVVAQWHAGTSELSTVCSCTSDRQPLPNLTFGTDEGTVGKVWHERRALYSRTLAQFSTSLREIAARVDAESNIVVPVITTSGAWGELIVFLRHAPLFAEDDINLLNLFVEQSAVVLEHERLLAEQRTRVARANALAEVSQLLTDVRSDYSAVLDVIAHRVSELLGDTCVITLLSKDKQSLEPVAMHHPDPKGLELMRAFAPVRSLLARDSMRAKVVRTGRAVRVEHMAREQLRDKIEPEYHSYLDQFGLHSLLIVPLRVQGRVIGTLGVSRDRAGQPYTPDDEKLLQDIADRAALAIANAQEFAERQQAEQALRESEERFAKAFRASPAAVVITRRADGVFLDANDSWERLFGYTRDETIGRTSSDLNLYSDPEQRVKFWKRLRESDNIRDVEIEFRTKSGEMRHMLVSIEMLQLGDVPALLGIFYDITARKRAEQALIRQSQRLEQQARLLELAHDGIFVRDVKGEIRYWNHGAEEMYGWTRAEAVGKTTNELLQTRFPKPPAEIINDLMAKGHWEGELEHLRRDGKRIVVASRWALQRGGQTADQTILEINNDITEQKQAEMERQESELRFRSVTQSASDAII
ncbi:MAG: PAS domain S-box protein, partial [Chloroflexi bacterium]|nr:PAS domain S-box protein [Chloroflexota bacterium]